MLSCSRRGCEAVRQRRLGPGAGANVCARHGAADPWWRAIPPRQRDRDCRTMKCHECAPPPPAAAATRLTPLLPPLEGAPSHFYCRILSNPVVFYFSTKRKPLRDSDCINVIMRWILKKCRYVIQNKVEAYGKMHF